MGPNGLETNGANGLGHHDTHEEKLAKRGRGSFGEHEAGFETPPVDWEEAARFRPSKLKGNGLTYMVTFVAGTGFTLFGYDQGVMSGEDEPSGGADSRHAHAPHLHGAVPEHGDRARFRR
jgi:hypothetical protein